MIATDAAPKLQGNVAFLDPQAQSTLGVRVVIETGYSNVVCDEECKNA